MTSRHASDANLCAAGAIFPAAQRGGIPPQAARKKWIFGGIMQQKTSELLVVTKAKELCAYVITATQKSPKQFRFTFVTRMQNLALDIIEQIYRANEEFIGPGGSAAARQQRLDFQHGALTNCRLLAYISELALTQQCILPKQYAQIALLTTNCQRLLGAWLNSDKKRTSSAAARGEPALQ